MPRPYHITREEASLALGRVARVYTRRKRDRTIGTVIAVTDTTLTLLDPYPPYRNRCDRELVDVEDLAIITEPIPWNGPL